MGFIKERFTSLISKKVACGAGAFALLQDHPYALAIAVVGYMFAQAYTDAHKDR
tara:strand:- start:2736 stop:2897 length:162 start_codon:yes stop_codon:yes gene_type:complete